MSAFKIFVRIFLMIAVRAYCNTGKSNVVTCGEEMKCVLNETTMVEDRTEKKDIVLEENCGEVQPAIVIAIGGRVVEQTEAPWHSGIYLKTSTPYRQICGGTLIRKDVVISAAHCFWSDVSGVQPADQYAVAVGKIYRPWNNPRDDNAQKSDVKEIKIPPRFHGSATNFQDDLALLVLSSPFTYSLHVAPVCLSFDYDLDKEQLSEGNVGKVCGWGLTSANGVASQTLQVVDMPVVSVEQCIRDTPYEFKSHITSDKICAGNVNVTAVCRGDSGGGLVVSSDGSTRYHLRGVVSTAPNDGNLCNDHSWATFTHLLRHEHFIRENLGFFKNK